MSNRFLRPSLVLLLSLLLAVALVPAAFTAAPEAAMGKGRCKTECADEIDAWRAFKEDARELRAQRKELRLEFAGLEPGDERRQEIREEIRGLREQLKELRAGRKDAHAAVRACRQACRNGG